MANKFQVKRTTVSGRTPNTTSSGNTHFIDTGELALNLTDGKMFSSNGTVYFEVGANLQNISITSNATFGSSGKIVANGSFGTDGQVLTSNGTTMYWSTGGGGGSGTVTQVNTGVGLSGGPITTTGTISVVANDGIVANATGLFANAGTGVVVNATGIHVNSSYIGTLAANSATYLGGNTALDLRNYSDTQSGTAYTNATAFAANATNISSGTLDALRLPASVVQNTDSRTLSGNLVISGTYFNPSSNTILLGNSTQRWVISANTADFTGTVTGTVANMSTSVNSAVLTVGTSFIANTTGVYHTGTVNAASLTTSGVVANATGITPTSNTILLGNSTGRFVILANTGDFTGAITSSGGVNPASNTTGAALGSATARFVLNANSGNFTANIAMNNNHITGLSDPSNAQDAATKAYVDTFQQGLHVHASVAAATTNTLATLSGGSVTYDNGTAGVGATLTLGTTLATLDGYSLVNGDRVIIKNEANTAHNGIYTRTSSTVLTRATDFDTAAEVAGGDFVFVTNGTLYNSTGWVQIDEVTTIGTDPIEFQQFSGQGTFTAGQYLYLIGSQFNANATSNSTASVLIARDSSQNFAANTATLNNLNAGTINATSNGLFANSTTLSLGNSSVNVAITPSTIELGTELDANSTGLFHTGTVNAASYTTSGFVANTTAIVPTSNTILLGNSTGRFVLSANTGSFSGAVSGITTLAAGNTTVTGFVNASSTGQFGGNVTVTGIIEPKNQILMGAPNAYVRTFASGYSTTHTPTDPHEIGRITFTGNSQNITIIGEIRGATGASVGVTRFILDLRSNTLPSKSFTLFEEETTNLGRLITVRVYQDTTTGLVVLAYSCPEQIQNIGWSLNIQERGNYNYLEQVSTLTPLNTVGLTEVSLTSTVRTVSGSFVVSGTVNAASHTTSGFVANTTAIAPTSNTILLGNSIGRFVISANTIDTSGLITGGAGATITGQVNASTGFGSGTINATSNGLFANATTISLGNSSVNVAITTAGITSSGGTGVNPSSNTVGTALGTTTQRWVVTANSISTSGSGSIGTTLAAGNTTVTGFVNATSTIQGGSSLTIAGAASGITTLAAGNTTITGFANASVSVNSALLTVGTSFIANTTGAFHTGIINAASHTTSGFVANTTAIVPTSNTILLGNSIGRFVLSANTIDTSGLITGGAGATITGQVNASTGFGSGTINATSNGLFANATTISLGNSSVNVAITTAGITSSGGTGVNPSSNTLGTSLGTTTQRWVVTANSISTSGSGSIGTTLAAGNTTVTGFVNATSTIQGGSSLTIAGAASGITTLAAGNTTITGFANASVSVNSALLTVGTSFIANTTGVYHTGLVNAASINIGSSSFIANSTAVVIADPLTANGSTGTAGHVLHSNGSSGSPYWAVDDSTTTTDDTTTNGDRYILFANQTSGTLSTAYVSSTKMYFNPSTGKLNATSFNSLSDVFSKENIKTLDSAISKILMMRGVSFTWKGTEDKSIGVIAQEVEQVLPEVVSTSEDGIKSVSYDSIIGLLIEGIKEQQQTIEQMKNSINILLEKNKIDGEA